MQHISGTYILYGSETFARMTKTNLTVTAAEMKFVRKAAQCTPFDHRQYQDILNELQTVPPLGKINNYKNKWIHPPSRAQVKKCGVILFLPQMPSWCGQSNLYISCSMFENGQISTHILLRNINWPEKECRTS